MKKWYVKYVARVREVWEVEAEDEEAAFDLAESGMGKQLSAEQIGVETYSWTAKEVRDIDQEGTRTDP